MAHRKRTIADTCLMNTSTPWTVGFTFSALTLVCLRDAAFLKRRSAAGENNQQCSLCYSIGLMFIVTTLLMDHKPTCVAISILIRDIFICHSSVLFTRSYLIFQSFCSSNFCLFLENSDNRAHGLWNHQQVESMQSVHLGLLRSSSRPKSINFYIA